MAILEVWQANDLALAADFADLWQAQDLTAFFKEAEVGAGGMRNTAYRGDI